MKRSLRALVSLVLCNVMIFGAVPVILASESEASADTVVPTALFGALDMQGSNYMGDSDTAGYYYDTESGMPTLRYEAIKEDSTVNNTRFVVTLDQFLFPEDFTLLESKYMKIGYRSNISTAKVFQLNPHPGAGNIFFGPRISSVYDGQWQSAVCDLSSLNWTGGQKLTSTAIVDPGSEDSERALKIFEGNFDGIMNKVTFKPFGNNSTAMHIGDYFELSYIAFFDTAEAAESYVYNGPEARVKNVTVGDIPLSDCAIVLGDDLAPTDITAVNAFIKKIYDMTGIYLQTVDADSMSEGRIIFGGFSDKTAALADGISDGEYAIKTDGSDLVIASRCDHGIVFAINYILDTYFGGADNGYTADGVTVSMNAIYSESPLWKTENTDNVKALDYITSIPDGAVIGTVKINGMTSPFGMDDKTPQIEWYITSPERTEKQESYRIVIAVSEENLLSGEYVFDTGAVLSDSTSYTLTDETILSPRTKYFMTVTSVLSVSGDITSDIITFETGLLDDGFGEADWIGTSDSDYIRLTSGVVEAKLTYLQKETAVIFGCASDESEFLMWQLNTSKANYPMLRPHYYNGSYKSKDISLEDIFPTNDDLINSEVTMRMEINEGVVDTYINGTYVYTYKTDPFEIGIVKERPGYASNASYESILTYNVDGIVVNDPDTVLASPTYRRDFTVDGNIKSARLYASALGAYEIEINGKRVGDSYLNPGRTAYESKLYYQIYDVTDMLEENNAISATVGEGWFKFKSYGSVSAFIAKLVVTYDDGSEYVLNTDSTWSVSEYGPLLKSNLHTGEYYDARRELTGASLYNGVSGWSGAEVFDDTSVLFSAASLDVGQLVAESMEHVRNVITFRPISVNRIADDIYIYDFGQNIAGTVTVSAQAKEGTAMTLQFGEIMQGFDIRTDYYNDHNGPDTYIFAGNGVETYTPSFVYHGFRYLRIEGLTQVLDFDDVSALVLTNDLRRTGTFESSNSLLNRYYENSIWSQRGNFVSNITDCPTREKNGWTGDAQIFAKASSFHSDSRNIYENFMDMIRSSQSAGGAVPEIVPSKGPTSNTAKTPSGWSDAVVTIPYELYMQYGDISLLEDNYDAMKGWISYLLDYKINDEYLRLDGNYGDHTAYFNKIANLGYQEQNYGASDVQWYETSFGEIGTAYTAYSCSLIAEIAQILGNDEDVTYYTDLFEKFAAAWRANYLEEDGITSVANSQTSYVMGLYFNLFENEEMKLAAADKLCEKIEADGGVQSVGFIGLPDYLNALSENGKVDVAYKLLLNTEMPSLLYSVTQGATSIWENYKGDGVSQNHYAQASPSKWLYTDVLGIDHRRVHENAGYKSFTLEPKIGYGLTYAKGAYESANGIIRSAWELTDNGYTYSCTVPANTSATLTLPKNGTSVNVLESGEALSEAYGVSLLEETDNGIAVSLESGSYNFEVIKNTELGDVDGDASITPTDGVVLSRYLAEWAGYEEAIVKEASDVDDKGSI
ncbi:MAG: family 78 glycoside hydrolase catalytic domain [Clostridia bacterium]|nr:family 78 glycoside hydrolase catalytic domain [Clostridia bacterium]